MAAQKNKKPGRPNSGRTEYIEVRVSPQEKARYEESAQQYGITLSDWVRLSLTAMSAPKAPDPMTLIHRN